MIPLYQWLITFLITVSVEIVIAWPILGLISNAKTNNRSRRLWAIVFANVLTHPIVYGVTELGGLMTFPSGETRSLPVNVVLVLLLELGASIVEAIVYRRVLCPPRSGVLSTMSTLVAIAASFTANAASLLASLLAGLFFWR